MASPDGPHPEERLKGASRRTRLACLIALAALLVGSCSDPQRDYPPVRKPLGVREALHPGHWRGPMGMTEVDYYIDQVQPSAVAVHVSGTVLRQANKSLQTTSGVDNYFYDRPRTCKRTADGKSFDCTRYVDMHIDNGLLCGVYETPGQVYRPCFEPVP
jgi:hypothetical protein